jgi:hypothetical protein
MLTLAYLKGVLDYDPETGIFTWRERRLEMFDNSKKSAARACSSWNRRFAGRFAGTPDKDGYIVIVVQYRQYKAHRLAWFYMKGEWPADEIDHWDLDVANNKWLNLREATGSQNHANLSSIGSTGFKGVTAKGKKFYVRIKKNGETHCLGTFDRAEEAAVRYDDAATAMFGEFARLNNPYSSH